MSDPGAPDAGGDARRHAPASLRNREPIRLVLQKFLPAEARVLEVAAGSGEHACFFADAFPGVVWQPSDADAECLASIDAWRRLASPANLLPPLRLDVGQRPWPLPSGFRPDAVVAINLIHIAPWQACLDLLEGAATVLPVAGVLYLYGPFRRGGRHTAASNATFDASLQASDPAWGVRDLDEVSAAAEACGFALEAITAMPANNLSVLFRRRPAAD